MKRLILLLIFCCALPAVASSKKKQPVPVILTAGQSNTDGRVSNDELPEYIKQNGYQHCYWCYGSEGKLQTNGFERFSPKTGNPSKPHRWAYDAVTYYWLEQSLKRDFYVIKWSLGGTAIDPRCSSNGGKYWTADASWLSSNRPTSEGGKSLLLSFTQEIERCIKEELNLLPNGYEFKAFLWHQGESDRQQGASYYRNLKSVIDYVRSFLVEKTGNKKYRKLPFVCGTVARNNKQYNAEVEQALYRLAKEDKHFYVVDMADAELQEDGLHFTATSAEYLGKSMYSLLKSHF